MDYIEEECIMLRGNSWEFSRLDETGLSDSEKLSIFNLKVVFKSSECLVSDLGL